MSELCVGSWLIGIILMRTQRRDRRLLARAPHIGAGIVVSLLGSYALLRVWFVPGRLDHADAAILRVVLGACSGFAMPLVYAWTRALLRQDLPRLIRAVRDDPAWYATCAVSGATYALLYFLLGRHFALRGAFEVLDMLFDADPPFQQYGFGARIHPHTHPLLPLFWRIGSRAMSPLVGLQWAPLAFNCVLGGICLTLAAAYFRAVTGSRLLGLLAALILASTASHIVFGSLPESWALSAIALILLQCVVAARTSTSCRHRHLVLASLLACGVTITSGAAVLVCWLLAQKSARLSVRLKRFVAHCVALGTFGFALQMVVVPDGDPLLPAHYLDELRFLELDRPLSQRLVTLAHGLFVQNIVGWVPRVAYSYGRPGLAASWEYDGVGLATAAIWLALIGLALLRALRGRVACDRPLLATCACLALAAGFFSYYGLSNMFLYSSTFTFYVIAIVARGLSHDNERVAAAILGAFWLLLAVNNLRFAIRVVAMLDQIAQAGSGP